MCLQRHLQSHIHWVIEKLREKKEVSGFSTTVNSKISLLAVIHDVNNIQIEIGSILKIPLTFPQIFSFLREQ